MRLVVIGEDAHGEAADAAAVAGFETMAQAGAPRDADPYGPGAEPVT